MPITMNPATEVDRVRRYTSPEMLKRIDEQIERNIRFYSAQPDEVIARRIEQLKNEWSIERYLQINVACLGFWGSFMALAGRKRWGLAACGAFGFFLFHGIRGWDPPIPLLRRRGIRTRGEIDREMYALKALRGDFQNIPGERPQTSEAPAREAIQAANA